MTDLVDTAQVYEEELRRVAIMEHGRNHLQRRSLKTEKTHCDDCGEEIPKARRRALPGCCLCVDCQNDQERARSVK